MKVDMLFKQKRKQSECLGTETLRGIHWEKLICIYPTPPHEMNASRAQFICIVILV